MTDETDHLQAIWNDIRDDIKKKTDQRSSYAVQYILALAALVGAYITLNSPTVSNTTGSDSIIGAILLLFAPPISIYYTILIMETFDSQQKQRSYLRTIIEPKLAQLMKVSISDEWETYFAHNDRLNLGNIYSKILPSLFISIMWAIFFSVLYIIFTTNRINIISDKFGLYPLYLYVLVNLIFCIIATINGINKIISLFGDFSYWIAEVKVNWGRSKTEKPKVAVSPDSNLYTIVKIISMIFGFCIGYGLVYLLLYMFYQMFIVLSQLPLYPPQGSLFHSDVLDFFISISNPGARWLISIPFGLLGALEGLIIWDE